LFNRRAAWFTALGLTLTGWKPEFLYACDRHFSKAQRRNERLSRSAVPDMNLQTLNEHLGTPEYNLETVNDIHRPSTDQLETPNTLLDFPIDRLETLDNRMQVFLEHSYARKETLNTTLGTPNVSLNAAVDEEKVIDKVEEPNSSKKEVGIQCSLQGSPPLPNYGGNYTGKAISQIVTENASLKRKLQEAEECCKRQALEKDSLLKQIAVLEGKSTQKPVSDLNDELSKLHVMSK